MDAAVQSQPMPPEYRNYRAEVMCNDCLKTSNVAFHFLYNKVCLSLWFLVRIHRLTTLCVFCRSAHSVILTTPKWCPRIKAHRTVHTRALDPLVPLPLWGLQAG